MSSNHCSSSDTHDNAFYEVEESPSTASRKDEEDETSSFPLEAPCDNQDVASATAATMLERSSSSSVGATATATANTTVTVTATAAFIHKARVSRKRRATALPVVPLPPKVIGGLASSSSSLNKGRSGRHSCNCKRSNCLKLYCDCFQAGIHCQPGLCNCLACNNLLQYEDQRLSQILLTMERNPNAFRPKQLWLGTYERKNTVVVPTASTNKFAPATTTKVITHRPGGCNCKKSNCLKKYCECFQAAVCCTVANCYCLNCGNYESNPQRILLVKHVKRRRPHTVAKVAKEQEKLALTLHMMGGTNGTDPRTTIIDNTMVAAAAAATVVGVVDAGLPPLAYAIPTKIAGSEFEEAKPFHALSFGSTNPAQTVHPVTATVHAKKSLSIPKSNVITNIDPNGNFIRRRAILLGRNTDLEAAWNNETATVGRVFSSLRRGVRKRPKYAVEMDSSSQLAGNQRDVQVSATKLLITVQADMARLVGAIEKAERDTVNYLDTKEKEDEASKQDDTIEDAVVATGVNKVLEKKESPSSSVEASASDKLQESALHCEEILEDDINGNEVSKTATRQLTILANQDVALLRELTSIIRRKTLNIVKLRMRESAQKL